jgi:hypothetical protein
MKSFTDYLIESKEANKYVFKLKVAGDLPEHFEVTTETALKKYQVSKFAKTKTAPIQNKLVDFPAMENAQVTVFDIELEYPTTSTVLTNYISEHTGMSAQCIRVRSLKEEEEAELNAENSASEKSEKALLTQDYEKENNQKVVGDKGVANFLKELSKTRKEHEPQQYKGVNDAILAKKAPKGTEK